MQKWKVWALALVYAVVSTSPIVYFHGCCCGTEQSWFVPPADCCDEHDHHHSNSIEEQCCEESSIQLRVDDQISSIDFPDLIQLCSNSGPHISFANHESEIVSRVFVYSKSPPISIERCILFSSLIFYDSSNL